ncbi:hypothetical protein PUN28_010173 [Cardiocondyla obscurior]|uniref:Uncharacterized protein n=1 Tax=Cardiocondyla obscurior TaxID=286306 RepID=A0AAW2FTD3_9HYME
MHKSTVLGPVLNDMEEVQERRRERRSSGEIELEEDDNARMRLRACVRVYSVRARPRTCVPCVRVRVPHCGLEEVERIRENRVSFRSASSRGLSPFVLSSRNPEEEEEEDDDDNEEEEEEQDKGRGYLSQIILPCPATTCDPAVNPPSFQDPFLPSFLPDASSFFSHYFFVHFLHYRHL